MRVAAAVDVGDLRVCLSGERFLGWAGGASDFWVVDLLGDPLGRPRFLGWAGGASDFWGDDLLLDPLGRPRGRLTCDGVNPV